MKNLGPCMACDDHEADFICKRCDEVYCYGCGDADSELCSECHEDAEAADQICEGCGCYMKEGRDLDHNDVVCSPECRAKVKEEYAGIHEPDGHEQHEAAMLARRNNG